jgi:hypothetical protein
VLRKPRKPDFTLKKPLKNDILSKKFDPCLWLMSKKIGTNVFFLGHPEHLGKGAKKTIYDKSNPKARILI